VATLKISSESTEYVLIPVESTDEFDVPTDPTADPVEVAFMLGKTEPEETDWTAAAWVTNGETHKVRILVGPEGLTLAEGKYRPWIRVDANPEKPVKPAPNVLVVY
jgi:hypothetical protein